MAEQSEFNQFVLPALALDRSMQLVSPATAFLDGLSEEDYQRIKRSSLSSPESFTSQSLVHPSPDRHSDDQDLPDVLRRETYSHIFSKLPLRLINLRERKLVERSTVAECLTLSDKLRAGAERIKSKERQVLKDACTLTSTQRDRMRDTIITEWVEDVTRFTILSHTWERGELSYKDLHGENNLSALRPHAVDEDSDSKRSFDKLWNFCDVAEEYGTKFAWADSVCVDKSSSAELDESIRSMFSWYFNAAICIVHLAQTNDLRDFVRDRWFTRGWTLQELLAPRRLKFHSKDWYRLTDFLNDKISAADVRKLNDTSLSRQYDLLACAIREATGLSMCHILDFTPGIRHPSVPERMRWIGRRVTTREEDASYSLMGIFNVSISITYGEGQERAFFRLLQAILQVGHEMDWFLFTGRSVSPSIHPSRMIPSSPKCYLTWDVEYGTRIPECRMASIKEPLNLTNAGLLMKILFVPAQVTELGPYSPNPNDTPPHAVISCHSSGFSQRSVEIRGIRRDGWARMPEDFALGFVNVNPEEPDDGDLYPDRLYAILLRRVSAPVSSAWTRCNTDEIIVFKSYDKSKISAAREEWSATNRALSTSGKEDQTQTSRIGFRMMILIVCRQW